MAFILQVTLLWCYNRDMEDERSRARRIVHDRRSQCPLACTLDLIGDKWTLLVMRDMLIFEKSQFNEFLASPEGISTNVLAERLRRLEQHGLIAKQPYQSNPVRYAYAPTPRGAALKPAIRELVTWALAHIEGTRIGC